MTRAAVGYFSWCAAIVASSLAFVLPAFVTIPVLWYYPLAHTWELQAKPTGFAMDWYGRTFWALVAGAIVFVVGSLVAGRIGRPSRRAFLLWAAWAGMTSVLAMAVYTYQLAHRHPVPEPLPSDYQPR